MAHETLAAWLDIAVVDAERSRAFYTEILGVSTSAIPMSDEQGSYNDHCVHAVKDGPALAGVCHRRGLNSAVPAAWIPYFRVASLNEAVARAVALGAAVIDGPRDCAGTHIAIVRDLDGAVFGLVGA
jgi:uncharacterized protein